MELATTIGTGLTAAAILLAAGAASATEIIVPDQMPLSVALQVAASGDTISIRPSATPYTQFPGFSFSGKRLTIRGMSGNPADVVLDGAGLDRVLSISGAGADGSVIEGLTIRNGRGPAAVESSGAGLYIVDANVTVENCIIRDNVMPSNEGNGAGLYASTGSVLTFRDTLFHNNSVAGINGDGPAVFLTTGSAGFVNCQFTSNSAEPTVGTDDLSFGGAAYLDAGSFRFTRCTFSGNQAELGGAIYATGTAAVTVDAGRFVDNHSHWGGTFYAPTGSAVVVVRNSLFANNASTAGGAAGEFNRATNLINCTVAGNAGGLFIFTCSASNRQVFTVDNCIIWDNTAGSMSPGTGTNLPIIRRCLVQFPYVVANGSGFNTVADPKFVGAGDYHLDISSPAIDAGDTSLYVGPLADFDLNPRGLDQANVPDTGASFYGPVIDIGMYEFNPVACYANCDGSTVPPILNVSDFVCFMTRYAAGCP